MGTATMIVHAVVSRLFSTMHRPLAKHCHQIALPVMLALLHLAMPSSTCTLVRVFPRENTNGRTALFNDNRAVRTFPSQFHLPAGPEPCCRDLAHFQHQLAQHVIGCT